MTGCGTKTDVPIALANVCFEGEERKWRGLAAMPLKTHMRHHLPAAFLRDGTDGVIDLGRKTVRRREFVALFGASVACPFAAMERTCDYRTRWVDFDHRTSKSLGSHRKIKSKSDFFVRN